MSDLLSTDPDLTAVLTMNEDAAFGVLAELHARGLVIPGDVSVLSVVTSPGVASLYSPPLSSFDVQGAEAGAAAIDSLLTVIRGEGVPPGVLTCCDLVERGSVAPPPHRTHP